MLTFNNERDTDMMVITVLNLVSRSYDDGSTDLYLSVNTQSVHGRLSPFSGELSVAGATRIGNGWRG